MISEALAPTRPASSQETREFVDQCREVLQQLAVLIRNTHFHDLSNEVFQEPLDKLTALLEPVLDQEQNLHLERVGGELYANGTRIRMEIRTLHSYKFVWQELAERGLGGVGLEAGVSRDSLMNLLAVLAQRSTNGRDAVADFNKALAERGVGGIKALPLRKSDSDPWSIEEALDRRQRAIHTYQRALDFVRSSLAELESPSQVNQRRAKRLVQRLVDLSYEEGVGFSLVGLASIKDHDNYTFNHMVNVCVLAIAFGQRLGLGRRELAELGLCALYHDLGKLHIPPELLNKHAPLTQKEWALMGNHTVYAARTLFPLVSGDSRILKPILTALQHHLGYDGKGYPRLRLLRRQTLYTRIVAIVDTYDAMTTKRVYQEDFLPDAALRRIFKYRGNYCDPLLVKAFINCMGVFPVGSTVELTSQELAVVVESTPDPQKVKQPRVRVVADREKSPVEPFLVDLSQPEESGRQILHCVDPERYGINSAHYGF